MADKILRLNLTENDTFYLDLLSNQVYIGTDEDGNTIEPHKDNSKMWHISGSPW